MQRILALFTAEDEDSFGSMVNLFVIMRKIKEIVLTGACLVCSVIGAQTTAPVEALAGKNLIGETADDNTTISEMMQNANESTASVVTMLKSVPMPEMQSAQVMTGIPQKIMKAIDTPETTITVMISAPEGHEERMNQLREAYTSAGLTSSNVAKLLQLDARIILAREVGNTAGVTPLTEERNKILSVSQRQNVRNFLIFDAMRRKAEKNRETTTETIATAEEQ